MRIVAILLSALAATSAAAQQAPLTVDRDNSYIVVITGRAGALRFLAHDHAMVAGEWQAEMALDRESPGNARVQMTVQAASMRVGSPEVHAKMGLSRRAPGESDIRDIERKMRGERILDSDNHPEIRFQASRIESGNDNKFTVTGPLTIRGTTREVTFPVEMERTDGSLVFSGGFEVRQSDFGIRPESLAAGMVRVADEVEVRFRILARPQSGAPPEP